MTLTLFGRFVTPKLTSSYFASPLSVQLLSIMWVIEIGNLKLKMKKDSHIQLIAGWAHDLIFLMSRCGECIQGMSSSMYIYSKGTSYNLKFLRLRAHLVLKKTRPLKCWVIEGANHLWSRRSWFCSTEIRFISPSALTKHYYLLLRGP